MNIMVIRHRRTCGSRLRRGRISIRRNVDGHGILHGGRGTRLNGGGHRTILDSGCDGRGSRGGIMHGQMLVSVLGLEYRLATGLPR